MSTTLDDLFPSPYLTANDVKHKPTVTIKNFSKKTMKNKQGEEEVKPVIFFNEFEKGMVLNKTNANVIAGMYGKVLEQWIGERVQLHSIVVEAFGESQDAIRVVNAKPVADKQTLLDRYAKLYERGVKAKMDGIENYSIGADMPEQEIIDLGRELKAKIEAAEQF
jgi:hypothetical protein